MAISVCRLSTSQFGREPPEMPQSWIGFTVLVLIVVAIVVLVTR
jgi:hypothetical protein